MHVEIQTVSKTHMSLWSPYGTQTPGTDCELLILHCTI